VKKKRQMADTPVTEEKDDPIKKISSIENIDENK